MNGHRLSPKMGYGGTETKGRRKAGRPFVGTLPVLFVFRARDSKNERSLAHRKNKARIMKLVYGLGARYKIKVLEFSNVGSQLHVLLQTDDRYSLTCFLRVMAGRVAQTITGAKKGLKRGRYWAGLCWSRLLKRGPELKKIQSFLRLSKITELALALGRERDSWKRLEPKELLRLHLLDRKTVVP